MQGSFSGLDLFFLVAVAVALKDLLPPPLIVVALQELGDFEFDGFLKHELSAQADGFRQWRLPCGRAEELCFEGLAGKLAFHASLSLSVLLVQLHSALN